MTIYEGLGGSAAIGQAVTMLYDRVVEDELLAPYFADVDLPQLRTHQKEYLIAALGGPELYQGRGLREGHAGLGIDDAAFDHLLEILVEILHEVGIDPGVIDAMTVRMQRLRVAVVEPS